MSDRSSSPARADLLAAVPAEPGSQTIDEWAHWCFGCGPGNPEGLHLEFAIDATDPQAITASAPVMLTRVHEGPPGHIHGGIIATLMDEAMSKLNRPLGLLAMTRNMNVDYLRPAPLGVALHIVAKHESREGRKLFHTAALMHPDGTVLARGHGLFLVIEPALLATLTAAKMDR